MEILKFQTLRDLRGYSGEEVSSSFLSMWRRYLRMTLFEDRKGLSDLSFTSLGTGFDMHEGLFPRSVIPASVSWHHLIYAGPNCFLLKREEHIPNPPNRTTCYWIAVARYGMELVNEWIDSLPFKVSPPTPWKGSHGLAVIKGIAEEKVVSKEFVSYYNQKHIIDRIDRIAE